MTIILGSVILIPKFQSVPQDICEHFQLSMCQPQQNFNQDGIWSDQIRVFRK